ncbi:hypothetical protein EI94DRAFT_1799121 [Lactarius quietus]|nr:hypothetical protein EI94DRAFT_1799121 [Lactarius quietus]
MNPFVLLTAFITLASALTINTPASVVTCEPVKFTWNAEDSKPPFFLALFPAGQPGADALKQFPPQDGDSYTWDKVDLPPNTSFTAGLKDGSGNQAFSAPATVRAGSTTNCANTYDASSSISSSSAPGVVAAATQSGGSTSSHAPAAAASSSPSTAPSQSAAPKAAASTSGSNATPSQSPSVKANSAARDISSVAIGMVVGLLSVAVFLVA